MRRFAGLVLYLNRKNVMLIVGLFFSAVFVLVAVFAKVLEPYKIA